MKKLTCEMCGSTDIVKKDGMYVCQTCGTKYSVEDAKKMMIEGTVDVSGSSVKIDNTEAIDNYYKMAESAYKSGNQKEAEDYCNKIIEIEPDNYKAWLLKGKAAGWQSTLANLRIGEAANCFEKAFANSLEEEVNKVKAEILSEFFNLSEASLKLASNSFVEYPSESSFSNFINCALEIAKAYSLLETNHVAADPAKTLTKMVANYLANGAVQAWNDKVYPDFKSAYKNSDFTYNQYSERINYCRQLISAAINVDSENKEANIQRYKNLIDLTSHEFQDNGWMKSDDVKARKAAIMEWHNKIKELDPDYVVPEPPSRYGCYVATCVYGSYDCPQVWTLRRYRDYTLAKTWYGRAFIRTYYAISPTIVRWFGDTNWFKAMWRGKLDRMVSDLQAKGVEDTPYEDRVW